jgi:hypothetical protein
MNNASSLVSAAATAVGISSTVAVNAIATAGGDREQASTGASFGIAVAAAPAVGGVAGGYLGGGAAPGGGAGGGGGGTVASPSR